MGAEKFHHTIHKLYYDSGCCTFHSHKLSQEEPPIIDSSRLIKKVLNRIYKKRGGTGEIDLALFELNNTPLQKGIDLTMKSAGVEFGKKNQGFIDQFKYNTAIFSAFKSHKESEELIKLLINEKGDLRSFHEFKKLSKPLINDYNKIWLKTEYDTVVRSARMAVNWKKFEERKHIFPNLEYMQSRAKNKRTEHLKWVGTILPMEHPWWNTHTPPVGWGCECWIRQTRAEATPVPEGYEEEIPEAFQNNHGVTAEPINIEKHPYVTESSISKNKAEDFVNSQVQKQEYVKQENVGLDKGELYIHTLADETPENATIGELLANTGHKVKLLPDIQPAQIELRKLLMPQGTKENKNPDALINGNIFEFKTLRKNTYNAVSKELKYAGDQADHILLKIDGSMDETIINRAIRGRIMLKENIREVWILLNGNLHKHNREYILGKEFGKK